MIIEIIKNNEKKCYGKIVATFLASVIFEIFPFFLIQAGF